MVSPGHEIMLRMPGSSECSAEEENDPHCEKEGSVDLELAAWGEGEPGRAGHQACQHRLQQQRQEGVEPEHQTRAPLPHPPRNLQQSAHRHMEQPSLATVEKTIDQS